MRHDLAFKILVAICLCVGSPFGMAVDPWFNLYTADSHSKPINQLIPGAFFDSSKQPHDGIGYAPHVTPSDLGPHQRWISSGSVCAR